MEMINQDASKFNRLYETLQDAFVSVNMQGLIEECNQEYLNMLGYDRSEIVHMTYQQLTPSKWHAFEEEIIRTQVLARGYSDVYEKEYQHKDGTIFPVELRTVLVRDDQGYPSVMWAIIRDITERKKAEQALRNSEEMNRVILDASSASIFLVDRAGIILATNEAAARRMNITSRELVGSRSLDFVPPQLVEQRWQMMESVFQSGMTIEYENQHGEYWYENSMHPVWGEDGQVDKLVVIANDVTRKKQTLDALQDSEQRYRSLAETAEDSIFIIDKEDTVTYVNAYGARFLGGSIDQVVGRKRADLFSGVQEKARSNNIQRVLRTGVPSINESIIYTPRGSAWLSTRLVPLRDSQGNINAVLGVARDITERKRNEKALIRRVTLWRNG